MSKYKIGEIVTVIDDGYAYTTHEEFFSKLEFFDGYQNFYDENDKCQPWIVCSKLKQYNTWVYKIQNIFNEKKQLLISKKGLIKIGGWEKPKNK